jgi:RimJ/RimL family protein N-acetyltransferase
MHRLRRRHRVRIRPLQRSDSSAVATVFHGLSPASRRRRYLAPVETLTGAMLTALVDVAPNRHVAFVAETRDGTPIGLSRYVVDTPGRAEIAYEVIDEWQGRGVGSRLLAALIASARENGVVTLHATLLADNDASLALLQRALPQLRIRRSNDVIAVTADLVPVDLTIDDVLDQLRAA